jgi:hypothetical protein
MGGIFDKSSSTSTFSNNSLTHYDYGWTKGSISAREERFSLFQSFPTGSWHT